MNMFMGKHLPDTEHPYLNLVKALKVLPCPFGTKNLYEVSKFNIYIYDVHNYALPCTKLKGSLDKMINDFVFDETNYIDASNSVLIIGDKPIEFKHVGKYVLGVIYNNRLYVHKKWLSVLS